MSSDFDPRRARTKRPLPLWVDSFIRDTQHLAADEIGAYHLILGAMWLHPYCAFPNDERKLTTVARCSKAKWRSRIGPAILPFFSVQQPWLISERLRKEATLVQIFCTKQHSRKFKDNPDKWLKYNNWDETADGSAAVSAAVSNLPTYSTIPNGIVSIPDGIDENAPESTKPIKDQLWERGPPYLTQNGVKDHQARSLIGRWLKDHTPGDVFAAFVAAAKAKTKDPVPYITAALQERNHGKPDSEAISAAAVRIADQL